MKYWHGKNITNGKSKGNTLLLTYTYVELWGQFLLKRKYIKRVELTKTNILVEAPNDHITGPSF